MLDPLDENNLRDHLTAFADGELDAAQSAALWAYLAERPDAPALRWLAEQHRLTLAARRVLDVPVPQDLKARMGNLVREHASADRSITSPRSWPRRFAYAIAVAAALIIGATVTHYTARPTSKTAVVPADLIVAVGRVHAECSRLPEHLHNAHLADADAKVAELMTTDLGGENPAGPGVPDLTAVGFRFVGAGPCPAAKFQTIHLLYRSARPAGLAAVSLFVQADAGQFPELKGGHVYRVSSSTSPFPVLAWRTGTVIYFLVADDEQAESSVLQTLHPTDSASIVTAGE